MSSQAFELLILGSSSASPTAERNQSAQLLNIAERHFLIDCGEATQIQLRRFKARFQKIDHIFISHLHGDHFFGLPGYLSSMHLLGRQQELTIYAPKELKKVLDVIHEVSETKLSYPVKWHFTDNKKQELLFEDDKVEVYSFPLKHRIYCTGFLFKEKPYQRKIDKFLLEKHGVSTADIHLLRDGFDVTNDKGEKVLNTKVTLDPPKPRTYAYCSDTIYDETLVEFIKNADLLYHESTFLDDKIDRAKITFHSTAKQAATIAKLSNAKKLLLGHFSARYGNLDQFVVEAKEVFDNCSLAIEGKVIQVEHSV
ncbi:MAG: ribonuclease Z [Bacteroidota bacterium]|nr:ribonuclease Z [Bacteroidota bacterium]